MSKFKRQTITLARSDATPGGSIKAHVCGDMAVYKARYPTRGAYHIAHAPTGLTFPITARLDFSTAKRMAVEFGEVITSTKLSGCDDGGTVARALKPKYLEIFPLGRYGGISPLWQAQCP